MKALITGITGSLGAVVTEELLTSDAEIIGYSRDECRQQQFPLKNKVTLYLGDVRDRDRVLEASRGCDVIFHLAAVKHVDLLENNPDEAIKTNVVGTMNVLYAQRINKIPKVVFSSTDKAVYPVNAYGMSKALGEKLVLRNPANVVCRWGNVIASKGSVVPLFVREIKKHGMVPITSLHMNRFWISLRDVAQFMVDCYLQDRCGLQIPNMKAAKVVDVAEAIGRILDKPPEVVVVGLRSGEKLDEDIRAREEGDWLSTANASQYSEKELIDTLRPIVESLL